MKIIIDLHLDGYDTKEEHDKACLEWVYEQLNFCGSCVDVISLEDYMSGVSFNSREPVVIKSKN